MRKLGPFVFLLIACDADSATKVTKGEQLIEDGEALMWRALGGEVELRQDAIDTLKAGLAEEPDHPRGSLLYGMTLLSAIAEDNNLGAAFQAVTALEHAIAVNPDDRRIPGWLGTVKVPIAQFTGTPEQLQAACDDMIAAADAYPEFNNVNLAIVFAKLPLASGYPQMALDRLDAIQSCAGTDVCQSTTRAPHNQEGALMLYGDVHARLGHKDDALAYYDEALSGPGAATWKYRARAESFRDGIDERIAKFMDEDPDNDPQLFAEGETSCVGCHAP